MKRLFGICVAFILWAIIWLPVHIVFGAMEGAVSAWDDIKDELLNKD